MGHYPHSANEKTGIKTKACAKGLDPLTAINILSLEP